MADETDETIEETPEEVVPPDPVETLRAELATERTANQASLQQMSAQFNQLQGAYNVLAAAKQDQPEKPSLIDDVTDEQVAAALEAGEFVKAAQLSRRQATAAAKRELHVYNDTTVAPLIGQINDIGIPAIASVTRQVVIQQLDPKGRELYEQHKDAVHARLAALPANVQLNAEAIQSCIALEAGQELLNGGLQKRIELEAQRLVRSGDVPGISVGANRNQPKADTINYAEIFGAGAEAAAREKGGWDSFAQSRGYDSMKAYCISTGVLNENGTLQ